MIPPSMQNSTPFPSIEPAIPLPSGFGDDIRNINASLEAVRDLNPEEATSEKQHAEDFASTSESVRAQDKAEASGLGLGTEHRDPAKTPFYDPSYTVAVHARRLVLLETLLTEHLEYVRMERELIEAEMFGSVRKTNT